MPGPGRDVNETANSAQWPDPLTDDTVDGMSVITFADEVASAHFGEGVSHPACLYD